MCLDEYLTATIFTVKSNWILQEMLKKKKKCRKIQFCIEEQKRGEIWSYNMFPSLKSPLFLKLTFFGMSETFVFSRLIKAFVFDALWMFSTSIKCSWSDIKERENCFISGGKKSIFTCHNAWIFYGQIQLNKKTLVSSLN